MNIHRWLYKIGKMIRKCTRHVNTSNISYHGHSLVRSRASIIATQKGLGTALLIAPPVLVLIAVGVAAGSTADIPEPPPADDISRSIPTPSASITPAKKIISTVQAQLQSIVATEKPQDHTTTVAAALVAIGLIGGFMTLRAIRRKGRGGGGPGKNVADANQEYPSGKNNIYREVHVQTGSEQHEENSTLNAGSGGDPFRPR
ncbi:hypothetical protein RSOLAG22IIIB_04673 [Rhizoctonia solani]|uniref:Transmembrane protein n=1 Tax=Rhizoctonia solani TaxID=456999 RepID=A0A0K6FZJ6_9AGAM|nr:hypothetical protein RSOLAG22IIIB_04673 [Rhizoctonia solani]